MTLKEMLAKKQAAVAGVQIPVAKPGGMVLKRDPEGDDEHALPATTAREERRLGFQEAGERIPMVHPSDGMDAGWAKLAHALDVELSVVIGPGPKDEAWLAVVPEGLGLNPPLLITKLPLVILPGTFNPF
jgi:hypothetical protein